MATLIYELAHKDGSVFEYPSEDAALRDVYTLVSRGDRSMAMDTALSCSTLNGRSRAIVEGDALIERALSRFEPGQPTKRSA